jgi:hypothetical protein
MEDGMAASAKNVAAAEENARLLKLLHDIEVSKLKNEVTELRKQVAQLSGTDPVLGQPQPLPRPASMKSSIKDVESYQAILNLMYEFMERTKDKKVGVNKYDVTFRWQTTSFQLATGATFPTKANSNAPNKNSPFRLLTLQSMWATGDFILSLLKLCPEKGQHVLL